MGAEHKDAKTYSKDNNSEDANGGKKHYLFMLATILQFPVGIHDSLCLLQERKNNLNNPKKETNREVQKKQLRNQKS